VAIIGAGFGGITAAARLLQAGISTFTIFERSEGVGGTWRENQYPGAEVDTHSALFSFQFRKYPWSRTHARQPEVLKYLDATVDDLGLRDRCQFGKAVTRAVWDESLHQYALETTAGFEGHFDVVISAVGIFNQPRYPDWPGLDEFQGPTFHTARWEHDVELSGRRVAVVGSGSSSAQVVPTIASKVSHLYVFQREPGWVLPKKDRDFDGEERARRARRISQLIERWKLLAFYDMFWSRAWYPNTKASAKWKAECMKFIESVFQDRPELKMAVTPTYPILGKRIVFSDTFYRTLLRDNVELIPHSVTRVTQNGIVDDQGVEREVDVLVLATGFRVAEFLSSFELVGRDGRALHEYWAGEPSAFLGITVPGFPNFFMLYGPNTNGGTIAFNLDCQARYAARAVARIAYHGVTSIDVRQEFADVYNRWLQERIQGTAMLTARNYFKSESGRVVTNFPYRISLYWLLTRLLGRVSSIETRLKTERVAREDPSRQVAIGKRG
jgi:cation diffusion facilitator CzcD-associated flavoprotein CzcO